MRYLPHTPEEIREMLAEIGVSSVDALFDSVPKAAQFEGQLNIPPALAEATLMRHLRELAARNASSDWLSFLGAGIYNHHIPPTVDQLLLRSEFYTAYTPYQPEVAQGTLQAIWEFQTIVSELFGLPLANASMYDGSTAAAEGAQMARRLTRRDKVLVSQCVHPQYREVIRTYLSGQQPQGYVEIPCTSSGTASVEALKAALDDETAACVVGYPSFGGGLVDLGGLSEAVHSNGSLLVSSTTEPYALALAKAPGQMGVDIATGEGQALACPPTFGGPGVGLFACRDDRKYLQQIPGRLCGETVDKHGSRGYVLTLSTREQHIRRERATSNICTNQGLLALALTIRSSLLGKSGFQRVAQSIVDRTQYLMGAISKLAGYSLLGGAPCFNEFVVCLSRGTAAELCDSLARQRIVAGLDLGQLDLAHPERLLVAVTEQHTLEDLDRFVSALDTHA